jgi:hypothetical protein
MSKRKDVEAKARNAITAAFFVASGLTAWQPETGATLSFLFAGLCAALGYGSAAYVKSEGARPSGTRPAGTVSIGP